MAKFGMSSSIDMFATIGDEDGVDVGTGDSPHASIGDEDSIYVGIRDDPRASIGDGDGLTSVGGGDGVGAISEDLNGTYTIDRDEVDDGRLSLGDSSLTTSFFLPTCPFSTRVM